MAGDVVLGIITTSALITNQNGGAMKKEPVTLKCRLCGNEIAFVRMTEEMALLVFSCTGYMCGSCFEKGGGVHEDDQLFHDYEMRKMCRPFFV